MSCRCYCAAADVSDLRLKVLLKTYTLSHGSRPRHGNINPETRVLLDYYTAHFICYLGILQHYESAFSVA